MNVYTIGFREKTAEQFFGALRGAGVRRLLDVRLSNSSQLAGFTKRQDLAFFLHEICAVEYVHEPQLAPTRELLDAYTKARGTWEAYEARFRALLAERQIEDLYDPAWFAVPTVLLCSEPTAERCHRRLVLEHLQACWGGLTITHL